MALSGLLTSLLLGTPSVEIPSSLEPVAMVAGGSASEAEGCPSDAEGNKRKKKKGGEEDEEDFLPSVPNPALS